LKVISGLNDEPKFEANSSMIESAQEIGSIFSQAFVQSLNCLREFVSQTQSCCLDEIVLRILSWFDQACSFLWHYSKFDSQWIVKHTVAFNRRMLVLSHIWELRISLG